MIISNPNKEMFYEIEIFLNEEICDGKVDYPIAISKNREFSGKYILYNTEQLSRKDINFNEFRDNNIFEIWDYSASNVEILKDNHISNVRHIPIKTSDDDIKKLKSYNTDENYIYDVIFVGWLSQRREIIINELTNKGVNVGIIGSNPTFGEERDKIISKSKILLNIHYRDDYKIFESIRCSKWLDIGKIVISENSLDNDIRCYNVEYNNLTNKVLELLNKKI